MLLSLCLPPDTIFSITNVVVFVVMSTSILPTKPTPDAGFSIQLVSDLHLERYPQSDVLDWTKFVVPVSPCIGLLGDIGYPFSKNYREFLKWCSTKFKHVFVLAGNHEYYHSLLTVSEIDDGIAALCAEIGAHFLKNKSIVINDVRIIGSTLWSHIPKTHMSDITLLVNDYKSIHLNESQYIKPFNTNEWHKSSIAFISSELKLACESKQHAIVLTHHAPLFHGTSDPMYVHVNKYIIKLFYRYDVPGRVVNYAFGSALDAFFNAKKYPALSVWAFGHTHYSVDKMIGKVRLVSNQWGYDAKGDQGKMCGKLHYSYV